MRLKLNDQGGEADRRWCRSIPGLRLRFADGALVGSIIATR
jgi:hypothetical protein